MEAEGSVGERCMMDIYLRKTSLAVCAILTGGMGGRFDRSRLVDARISRLSLLFKVDLSYFPDKNKTKKSPIRLIGNMRLIAF